MINEYKIIHTALGTDCWYFVWNQDTNEVVLPPTLAMNNHVLTPHMLVVADTLEECDSYIHEHGLTYMMDYIVRPDHTLENPTDIYTNIRVEDYLANLDIASLPPIQDIAPIAPIEPPTV